MRVLFATTDGAGHFGPLVPFAAACRDAGHDVLVAGPENAAGMVGRAGFAFRPLGAPSADEVARFHAGQTGLSTAEAMARAAGELYVRLYARAALGDMLAVIEEWRPDVVVRENAEFSALVAADRLGVPRAQISVGLSSVLAGRFAGAVAPELDALRAAEGAPAGTSSPPEPVLTLAPASLDDPAEPGATPVHRFREAVGVPGALEAWGEPEAPLVYVSFGTEVPSPNRPYFPALYRGVLDSLAGLSVRVLVTVSHRRDPAELGPVGPDVRIERWVPNTAALRGASVMVGHGGAGSVLGALAAGVPMALVPFFADQPRNAARVAELGAGVTLEGGVESIAALRVAVPRLLDEPGFATVAGRLADEIAALPPVDDAVGTLLALA